MALRWYSVSVLSNYEKRVAAAIREQVARKGLEEQIAQVLVPTEEVVEVRRGKKVQSERRYMPGYVLVQMDLNDQTYHIVNSTNRVIGFLGPQGRPTPMSDSEIGHIVNKTEEGAERPRILINFEIGEKVTVLDGPFEGFDGVVEEVDADHERLKASVTIFGRATPVELEFGQVRKGA